MGLGLFATRDLPPGRMIPIIGPNHITGEKENHIFTYRCSPEWGTIDGRPDLSTKHKVGANGLAIAMLVNEPDKIQNANCVFKMDHLVTCIPIKTGTQLLVYYGGGEYDNIRKRAGYSVDTTSPPEHWPYLDEFLPKEYPSSRTRQTNMIALLRQATREARPQGSSRWVHFNSLPTHRKKNIMKATINKLNNDMTTMKIAKSHIPGLPKDRNLGLIAAVDLGPGELIGPFTGDTWNTSSNPTPWVNYIDAQDPRGARPTRWINCSFTEKLSNVCATTNFNEDLTLIRVKKGHTINQGDEILIWYGDKYPWKPKELKDIEIRGTHPVDNDRTQSIRWITSENTQAPPTYLVKATFEALNHKLGNMGKTDTPPYDWNHLQWREGEKALEIRMIRSNNKWCLMGWLEGESCLVTPGIDTEKEAQEEKGLMNLIPRKNKTGKNEFNWIPTPLIYINDITRATWWLLGLILKWTGTLQSELQDSTDIRQEILSLLTKGKKGSRKHTHTPPEEPKGNPTQEKTWLRNIMAAGRQARYTEKEELGLDITWEYLPPPSDTQEGIPENKAAETAHRIWGGEQPMIHRSTQQNALRVITIGKDRSTIKYITPWQVWYLTRANPLEHWNWARQAPFPENEKHGNIQTNLWGINVQLINSMELALTIHDVLREGDHRAGSIHQDKPRWIDRHKQGDRILAGSMRRKGGRCPVCGQKKHWADWFWSNAHGKSLVVKCPGKGARNNGQSKIIKASREQLSCVYPPQTNLDSQESSHTESKHKSQEITETQQEKTTVRNPTSTPKKPPQPPSRDTNLTNIEGNHRVDDLVVLQFNTDGRSKTITSIVDYAKKHKVDVVCLQEMGEKNCRLTDDWFIDKGYTVHYHGQVAMLLALQTANKMLDMATPVWRSKSENFMGINLNLGSGKGNLQILNGYLPTNQDRRRKDDDKAQGMHLQLAAQALETEHTIICMDGNETISPKGRLFRQDGKGPKETTFPNADKTKSLGLSKMACYQNHLNDVHRKTNPDLYRGKEPKDAAMTHTQKVAENKISLAKIDYIWATETLTRRATECILIDDTKNWGEAQYTSYHRAIHTTFSWNKLWKNSSGKRGDIYYLKGTTPPKGPDMTKLTQELGDQIRKEVNTRLEGLKDRRNNIKKGRRSAGEKLDELNTILREVATGIAIKHLGKENGRDRRTQQEKIRAKMKLWDALRAKIIELENNTPKVLLTKKIEQEPIIVSMIQNLNGIHKVPTPITNQDWENWTKNKTHHRAKALYNGEDDFIQDAQIKHSRKELYKKIFKPHQSTKIESLWHVPSPTKETPHPKGEWITDPVGKEQLLTGYLKSIATLPRDEEQKEEQEPPRQPKQKKSLAGKNILRPPTRAELDKALSQLDGQVAGGILPPGLLKLITTKENKTKDKDTLAPGDYPKKAHKDNRNEEPELAEGARDFLMDIIELSFLARNIPRSEKNCTVTGIPKKKGFINDLTKIRPITVGPIVGRIINKIVATRLGDTLVQYNVLDPSQHAFLPGLNIHEPINAAIHCYEQSLSALKGSDEKACYAIYYDISKAYDCTRWSSIERALRRIGADQDLIDFVMNSLEGTTLAMKTGLKGQITPKVTLEKAIKQGCPLAPLLFALVMDELHAGYRTRGGYKLKNANKVMSSRGYCDDTMIVTNSWEQLKVMNDWTQDFFKKHHFEVSLPKTFLTGRNRDGSELRPNQNLTWGNNDIKKKGTDQPVRYLGLQLSMDLKWHAQISKMNGDVMGIVAALERRTITVLQGRYAIKEVLGPTLEIGLRHAKIPNYRLEHWDKWISRALRSRMDLEETKIHATALATILKIETIQDLYVTNKTVQLMENLNKRSELREHYRKQYEKASNQLYGETDESRKPTSSHNPTIQALNAMHKKGIWIEHNNSSIVGGINQIGQEQPLSKNELKNMHPVARTFMGARIPTHQTNGMWGADFKPPLNPLGERIWAVLCTDGSTFPTQPYSGAGMVYLCDKSLGDEMNIKGFGLQAYKNDNFVAEMLAIHWGLRSTPLTVPTRIWTDSQACIDAINTRLNLSNNSPPLSCAARPVLQSIIRVIHYKQKYGAKTEILKVKSHTGNRDRPSLGNEAADDMAKKAALRDSTEKDWDLTFPIMANELKYVACTKSRTEQPEEEKQIWEPLHGNIRKGISTHHKLNRIEAWEDINARPREGELIRDHRKGILDLIDKEWKNPSSSGIQFLVQTLCQAHREWPKPICDRCLEGKEESIQHLLTCPANGDLINNALIEITDILHIVPPEKDTIDWAPQDRGNNAHSKDTEKYIATLKQMSGARIGIKDPEDKGKTRAINKVTARKLIHNRKNPNSKMHKHTKDPLTPPRLRILTEGPEGTSIKTTTQSPREYPRGTYLATIGYYREDPTNKLLWIGRTTNDPASHPITVEWMERRDPSKPDEALWCHTGKLGKIHNERAIIAQVYWKEDARNMENHHKYMETTEWTGIKTEFDRICKNQLWKTTVKNKNKGKAAGKVLESHMPHIAGCDPEGGYIYREGDKQPPIRVLKDIEGTQHMTAEKAYNTGQRLSPLAGRIYIIDTKLTSGPLMDNIYYLEKEYSSSKVLATHPTLIEGFGIGHMVGQTKDTKLANAEIKPIQGNLTLLSTRHIQQGEKICRLITNETKKRKKEKVNREQKNNKKPRHNTTPPRELKEWLEKGKKHKNKNNQKHKRRESTKQKQRKRHCKAKPIVDLEECPVGIDTEWWHSRWAHRITEVDETIADVHYALEEEWEKFGLPETREEREHLDLEIEQEEHTNTHEAETEVELWWTNKIAESLGTKDLIMQESNYSSNHKKRKDNANGNHTSTNKGNKNNPLTPCPRSPILRPNKRGNRDRVETLAKKSWNLNEAFSIKAKGRRAFLSADHVMDYLDMIRDYAFKELGKIIWIPCSLFWAKARQEKWPTHSLEACFSKAISQGKIRGEPKSMEEIDLIIQPIHTDLHWTVGIINFSGLKIDITVLDSFNEENTGLERIALNMGAYYLNPELKMNQGVRAGKLWPTVQKHWKQIYTHNKAQQQTNEVDCGLFLMGYATSYALDQDGHLPFDPENTREYRDKLGLDIMTETLEHTLPREASDNEGPRTHRAGKKQKKAQTEEEVIDLTKTHETRTKKNPISTQTSQPNRMDGRNDRHTTRSIYDLNKDIWDLITRTESTQETSWNFRIAPDIKKLSDTYLHTTQCAHTNALTAGKNEVWLANTHKDIALGGKEGTTRDFMTHKSTWVNLASEAKTQITIQAAREAVTEGERWDKRTHESWDTINKQKDDLRKTKGGKKWNRKKGRRRTNPTRIVILVEEGQPLPQAANSIREYNLLLIKEKGTPTSKCTLEGLAFKNRQPNPQPIQVRVIESHRAHPIDMKGLRSEIQKMDPEGERFLINIPNQLENNWDNAPTTRSHTEQWNATSSALFWLNNDRNTDPTPVNTEVLLKKSHDTLLTHTPLAAWLGILPRDIKKLLEDLEVDREYCNKEAIANIKNVLLDTTRAIYRRYAGWKYRKKFGTAQELDS